MQRHLMLLEDSLYGPLYLHLHGELWSRMQRDL